ncbi:MAG: hypothetical protein ACRC1J_01070, partial [Sandaracinobacteroides sp.]
MPVPIDHGLVRLALLCILTLGPGCRQSEAGVAAGESSGKAAELARADAPELLPERRLSCTVSRATNVDLSREQDRSELSFEGSHRLDLFLPAIPAPPRSGDVDATEEVVTPNADPRTRITADPDGLASGVTGGFNRVADHWPARVELSAETGPRTFLLMILNPIDRDQRRADLFM